MDPKEAVSAGKPHAVCIPSPVQGHIKPMLQLAKLLFHKGFHITFVNNDSNHRSLLESGTPSPMDGLRDFKFEAIPDDKTQRSFAPFRDLLAKLNDTATSNAPPVSCIVSGAFNFFIFTVAQELGLPVTLFCPSSASNLMVLMHFSALRDKGFTPLKDESYVENGYLDTVIDWIPGMKAIRLRDLMSFVRTTDPDDPMFRLCIEAAERFSQASSIVVNAFNALEEDVLYAFSSMCIRIHAIGPLHLLVRELPDDPLKSIGYSLWREDTECLQWLDSKPPNTVVYVNFGSMAVLTPEQLTEFGWGLANSKHPFMWIIRPGLVTGGGEGVLSPEFLGETKERGMVTSWCQQEKVLNHEALGGFLTHSGWNSTIESMSEGVPMLCWPFFGDQLTNCRFTCKEWGMGMEIDYNVTRSQVEKLVKELMEGHKGKKMKVKAMEWKRKAREAVGVNGSSSIALNKLVDELRSSKPPK